MTPFSAFLNELCHSRRILRKELARKISVDPSYLSALAGGRKGPPNENFVQKMQERLGLSDEEKIRLNDAIRLSQRIYRMPCEANPKECELVWQVMSSLGRLKPAQINAINEILKL